ncbi:MAG: LPP20 family lipoprotein, partial [Treponema sp.]|nr:LPP20 family lipoprotein [Treponema sp.]
MKKCVYVLLTAVIALSLTLAGCATPSPASPKQAAKKLPSFVLNPPTAEGVVYGVGSSTSQDQSVALRQAKERAKVDLANKLSSQVKSMVTDYTRQAGTGQDVTDLKFYESISQSLTNTTLRGLQDGPAEFTEDGTLWIYVKISKTDAAQVAAEVFENEASQYAEFKAMNALAAMNAQLEKNDPALAPG